MDYKMRKVTRIISEPTKERIDLETERLISEGWIWAGRWKSGGWFVQQLTKYFNGDREIFAKENDHGS